MKTIEYPIKELVSIEMDENKIWWLRYETYHPSFPKSHKEIKVEEGTSYRQNKKEYRDFVKQTNKFCEEQNFLLEFGSSRMVGLRHQDILWSDKYVLGNHSFLPSILFPKVILGEYDLYSTSRYKNFGIPVSYYGNHHYKKYIEDNDGECPLPFPKDVKW